MQDRDEKKRHAIETAANLIKQDIKEIRQTGDSTAIRTLVFTLVSSDNGL